MQYLHFYKCNVLGGFRLTDLKKDVRQGEYFYLETHVAKISKSVQAALKARWMVEVSEKEASIHMKIPSVTGNIITKDGVRTPNKKKVLDIAVPDSKKITRNLESRQTENNKLAVKVKKQEEEQVAVPDFKEVSKRNEEKIKSIKDANKTSTETVALPDFKKVAENIEQNKKAIEVSQKHTTKSVFGDIDQEVALPDFKEVGKRIEEKQRSIDVSAHKDVDIVGNNKSFKKEEKVAIIIKDEKKEETSKEEITKDEEKEQIENVEIKPKRKRGRPKKSKTINDSKNNNESNALDDNQSTIIKSKKKRGRPRKKELVLSNN